MEDYHLHSSAMEKTEALGAVYVAQPLSRRRSPVLALMEQDHYRQKITFGRRSATAPDPRMKTRHAGPSPPKAPLIKRRFPILEWLPIYKIKSCLRGDIVAGLSVGIMLIPQEMAHASITGVPLQYGLYSATVPMIIYALLGTSRHLSVATSAVSAALVGAHLSSVEDESERVSQALMLTFLGGIFSLLMGMLRLGFVVAFFSKPMMSAFVSAAACLIALGQVGPLLGLSVDKSHFAVVVVYNILSQLDQVDVAAALIGLFSILFLLGAKALRKNIRGHLKRTKQAATQRGEEATNNSEGIVMAGEVSRPATPSSPSELSPYFPPSEAPQSQPEQEVDGGTEPAASRLANQGSKDWPISTPYRAEDVCSEESSDKRQCIRRGAWAEKALATLAILCSFSTLFVTIWGIIIGALLYTRWDYTTLPITGEVPMGLPKPVVPWNGVSFSEAADLILTALLVSVVSYMTSIAVAKRIAATNNYEIDPTQELYALGLAGFVGSFFQSLPVMGALSRTAVNAENCHTQLAALISATVVMLSLVLLMPLTFYLPKSSLAAIIMVAAVRLIDFRMPRWLFAVSRADFAVWCFSFLSTLMLDLVIGLGLSIFSSLVVIMYRTSKPNLTVLGILPDSSEVVDIIQEGAVELDGVVMARVETSLYFANCEKITNWFEALIRKSEDGELVVSTIIVDMISVNTIDATAITALESMLERCSKAGVGVVFTDCSWRVKMTLHRSGLQRKLAQKSLDISLAEALTVC